MCTVCRTITNTDTDFARVTSKRGTTSRRGLTRPQVSPSCTEDIDAAEAVISLHTYVPCRSVFAPLHLTGVLENIFTQSGEESATLQKYDLPTVYLQGVSCGNSKPHMVVVTVGHVDGSTLGRPLSSSTSSTST